MKMQNVYANTKLASIPLTILLVVAGLFGFVLLVPLNAAHAATPAVTVSPTSATVGSTITISGTGFKAAQPIAITSPVTTSGSTSSVTVQWLTYSACVPSVSYGNTGTSGTDGLVVGGCLTTDATGAFILQVGLPAMPGGPQTITIYDGTNTVTSSITVLPSVQLCIVWVSAGGCTNNSVADDILSTGYSETNTGNFYFLINGFASADSVSVSSPVIPSSPGFTCTVNSLGSCTQTNSLFSFQIQDQAGGAKSITATGATLSASTPFTILPWVSFYNSYTGPTAFSFLGAAPSSVLVEGHGFAASTTISANTITIGGVATTHSSVTTDSHGTFGVGANAQLVVSPVSGVPYGPADVVVAGTTFSFANGNINQGATGPLNIHPSPGKSTPLMGGVLISSSKGVSGSGTGVGLLDAATHTFGDNVWFMGYGLVPGNAVTITTTPTSTSGLPGITAPTPLVGTIQVPGFVPGSTNPDGNGAFFIAGNSYNPVSGAETSSETGTLGAEVANPYLVTFTQASGPANVVSPSYHTTALFYANQFDTGDIHTGTDFKGDGWCALAVCGYQGAWNVQAEMFAASSTITATVGGNTLASGTTTANGEFLTNSITMSAIDLAGGSWTVTASDGTNSGTDTFVIDPYVATGPALTATQGKAGLFVSLLTTSGYGVHGLKANTAYSLNWGAVGATGVQSLGTFTSTATGGIPVPGIQFAVPAGTVGFHVITLVQSGADALLGNTFQDTTSTAGPMSNYGDTIFYEQVNVNALPTVAHTGSSVTLSGTGLAASTSYEVTLAAGNLAPDNQILATFTTDASGNIPAAATFTVSSLPSGVAVPINGIPASSISPAPCTDLTNPATQYPEQATVYNIYLQTASEYGTATSYDGTGTLVVAGSVALNMTSAPAGHAVTLSAVSLCATTTYNIVYNYAENSQANGYSGSVVGALLTDNNGAGTAVITIPASASAGAYPIQLVRVGTAASQLGVLSVAPTLTVSTVGTTSCQSTSCLTVTGSPTQTTLGQQPALAVTYTNSANAQVTGVVYAVVHNAVGQTVYYTTATITPVAGGTATAYLVLAGLPSGTYSVSYFVENSAGVAISVQGTSSVTV